MPQANPSPKPIRFVDVALLRTGDQRVVFGLLVAASAIMGGLRLQSALTGRQVIEYDALPRREASFVVDLNRADATVLAELPTVGPALAARIVDYRRERGSFRSIEELLEVKGIGPKTFEAIRPHVRAGVPSE